MMPPDADAMEDDEPASTSCVSPSLLVKTPAGLEDPEVLARIEKNLAAANAAASEAVPDPLPNEEDAPSEKATPKKREVKNGSALAYAYTTGWPGEELGYFDMAETEPNIESFKKSNQGKVPDTGETLIPLISFDGGKRPPTPSEYPMVYASMFGERGTDGKPNSTNMKKAVRHQYKSQSLLRSTRPPTSRIHPTFTTLIAESYVMVDDAMCKALYEHLNRIELLPGADKNSELIEKETEKVVKYQSKAAESKSKVFAAREAREEAAALRKRKADEKKEGRKKAKAAAKADSSDDSDSSDDEKVPTVKVSKEAFPVLVSKRAAELMENDKNLSEKEAYDLALKKLLAAY